MNKKIEYRLTEKVYFSWYISIILWVYVYIIKSTSKYFEEELVHMKKLDSNKLTDKQQEFFKTHLAYLSTVDENGEPQVGPKQSMRVMMVT